MTLPLSDTLKSQAMAGAAQVAGRKDALNAWRERGGTALAALEFPERRSERWKYTSLQPLTDGYLERPAGNATDIPDVPELGGIQILIVNGMVSAEHPALPDGASLEVLSSAGTSGELPADDVFASYNAAALADGVRIRVGKGVRVETPLHVAFVNLGGQPGNSVAVRLEVELAPGAELSLIEHYLGQGPVLVSASTVFRVSEGARLVHYRLQSEQAESLHVGRVDLTLHGNSHATSFQLMRGSHLRRNDIHARLVEPGAELNLRGVFLGRDDSHIDNQINVEHCVPLCRSNQLYKGILNERARGVFNGRIHIHPGARGTDAHLSNKNLLMSREAEIDTKPELEIYNDDVKCAHGTTVGQLDPQQLFYLQARGVSRELALRMLGAGFVNELVRELPHEGVAHWVGDWLGEVL